MTRQDIKNWITLWETKKDFNEYPTETVMGYYREYVKTGQYPYLANVTNFISLKEKIDLQEETQEWHDLKTQVYLASQRIQDEMKSQKEKEMNENGFRLFNTMTPEMHGKIIEVCGNVNIDWITKSLDKIKAKAVCTDKLLGFQKPRMRTRYTPVNSSDEMYFKLI